MKEYYKSWQRCTDGYFPHSIIPWRQAKDTAQNLLEEVWLQMGMSPRAPFRFTQLSRSPSIWSLSPEGRWAHMTTPNNWMHYCIHVRVTLGEVRQPTSAFPCLEWITNCWHVPGWSQRKNHWSCCPGTKGSNLVLWKTIVHRGSPL